MRAGSMAAVLLLATAAHAFANVNVGDVLPDAELPVAGGKGTRSYLGDAVVNVFVFVKPGQDHSIETLKGLAECEKELAGKPVHWAAIVPPGAPPAEVAALARETGVAMPFLVDVGDALYGRLGVRLHPVVGIADRAHKLLNYQPFQKINYCDLVRAHVRRALGEIDDAAVAAVEHPADQTQGGDVEVARRHLRLAETLLKAKAFAKAADNARKALEKAPRLGGAWTVLGTALASDGKCPEALDAFAKALEIDASDAAAQEGKKRCEKK